MLPAGLAVLLAARADLPRSRLASASCRLTRGSHVNNLGWTALLEAVILGDDGPRRVAVLRARVEAGATGDLGARQGVTPLAHARARGFAEMVRVLEDTGRR